jgi:hypothetical protein
VDGILAALDFGTAIPRRAGTVFRPVHLPGNFRIPDSAWFGAVAEKQ